MAALECRHRDPKRFAPAIILSERERKVAGRSTELFSKARWGVRYARRKEKEGNFVR